MILKDNFYRAFEEKYRGSRENIKERQKIYLPFILPLHEIYPDDMVLDIGCGRGEWLELMQDNDIPAKGVDLDERMLEAGLSLGLNVEKGDGITFLHNADDESAIAITSFHVIEHISFKQLYNFINEAYRVLKPGGVLILETPNTENLKVASQTFYIDPTHSKPIPFALLSYLTEYLNFSRNKIVRLNEYDNLANQLFANLEQVFEFVSPDYALIAQKGAPAAIYEAIEEAFSHEFGLSLSEVVKKFDSHISQINTHSNSAKKSAEEAVYLSQEASRNAQEASRNAQEASRNAQEAWQHYNSILNSTSWKITKPLRYMAKKARWFFQGVKAWLTFSPESRPRRVLRNLFFSIKNYLNQYPKLKQLITKILNNFQQFKTKPKINENITLHNNTNQSISPRAKQIYDDLKQTIEK